MTSESVIIQGKRFSCSVTAGLVSGFVTNPTETIRVRWQVLSMTKTAGEPGLLHFAKRIIKTEGLIRGLWIPGCSGWMAGFGGSFGLRMGVYEPVQCGIESCTGLARGPQTAFMAGLCTGSFANAVFCPFFQAKNRLQAQGTASQGTLLSELVAITQENGLRGLYKGVSALFTFGGLFAGVQLFSYDATKRFMISQQMEEGPVLHLTSSSVSAVSAVLVSAPADVVLNRYQVASRLGIHYSSLLEAASELAKREGVLAFYRGTVPAVAKFLPLTLMSMPLFEQMRRVMGLGYLA